MTIYKASDLSKAKFIRKYKGPSGKMVYIYDLPGGRRVKGRAEEIKHSLETLQAAYRRRPAGQGRARPITSKADLNMVLTKTTFCMISAGRNPKSPHDRKLSDRAVKVRDRQLRADLVKAGYIFTPSKGRYGGDEESIFVMCHDANKGQLATLGAKYRQDSVLFVKDGNSELIETKGDRKGSAVMAGSGHEYVPDADDFYTVVDIAGESVKFSMNLLDIAKAITRLVIQLWKGREL